VSTGADSGFDKLPILAELRDRLNEHYLTTASAPPKHPRLIRARRWRPLALIAVLVLGGATGALAAAGVFQSPSVIKRYNQSITPVVNRAMNSPLCAIRHVAATTAAAAPASLLSTLAVLRRSARPGGISGGVLSELTTPGQTLYVRYARFARAVYGFAFYVSVGTTPVFAPLSISRCIAAATASFDHELARIPKALRDDETQIFNAAIRTQRVDWAQNKPVVGVGLHAISLYGAGGFGGGDGAAAVIESGKALGEGGAATGSGPDTSFVDGLVPDGVATVTFHYDAGSLGGYSHKRVPAANVTTRPVNNVFIAIVPRPTGNALPWTITWRAASGKIIKTIHER
jgi:hypothetical protein